MVRGGPTSNVRRPVALLQKRPYSPPVAQPTSRPCLSARLGPACGSLFNDLCSSRRAKLQRLSARLFLSACSSAPGDVRPGRCRLLQTQD